MELSGVYYNYLSDQATGTKEQSLAKQVSNKDYSKATDDEILDACKQFETFFTEQVMKEMMKTIGQGEDSVLNNQLVSYFMDGAVTEMAGMITEDGQLGLAQTLYEQMKINLRGADLIQESGNAADVKEA